MRRFLFPLGVAAALLLGVALRLSTRSELAAGDRVHALTSDDNYHLRRARFAVAHYPRTLVFDPLMNFPQGGVPIWPPLFDVALATPARLLHGAGATPQTVERGAAWIPILFAAGAITLSGLLGARVAGPGGGIAASLFVAICPGHILWTQYGHVDQHVAESFFGLLVLWLFVASRDQTGPAVDSERPADARGIGRARFLREVATGTALALATLAWQGAIYWGAIIALSLFLETLRTRQSIFRAAALVLGLAALVSACGTVFWLGDFRPPLTYISFGFFQPLFLAAMTGGVVLLDTLLALRRSRLSRREILARVAVLALAAVAVAPRAIAMAGGVARGLGYVLGKTAGTIASPVGYVSYPKDWLKGIFEARPLLADGLTLAIQDLSLAFFLAPAVVLLWAWKALRSDRPGVHIALAVWGSVTLVLVLAQRLNVYYAAPLCALALVESSRTVAGRLTRSPRARAWLAAGIGIALASPFAWSTPAGIRATQPAGSDLYATLDWMRRQLPHALDPYDPRLMAAPPGPPEIAQAGAVLAPWALGHLVLYEAGLPVVANNFGYGFEDSLSFFLAETEEEALVIARRRRARWVLATDLTARMNDYAGYRNKPPSLHATAQGLFPTDRYFRTLQCRLYDFDGKAFRAAGVDAPALAHFRLLFHSSTGIRRGSRWFARWKVFEID